MSRARDIEELEALWQGGASDEKVSDQAIEIVDRLEYEMKRARVNNDQAREELLNEQKRDFKSLINIINNVKHAHFLDKYIKYCKSRSMAAF